MTIYDFLSLCNSPGMMTVMVYRDGKVIYDGKDDEISGSVGYLKIESFDAPRRSGRMCIVAEGHNV